jgi:metallo-beta-lactamase family protein
MQLTFLGATGTVTGSKYLIEHGGARVLVDSGLFQGLKQLRLLNRAKFDVPPSSIDAVVLTHAHIDHTGYLPVLVRDGFRGMVYCTASTLDLCRILLPDSGYLQEEEARYANRKGFSRHHPALPLYTLVDAQRALEHLMPMAFDRNFDLPGDITIRFGRAGHILGAAFVLATSAGGSILFSGDLGRPGDVLLQPPADPPAADVVVLESTYGDRRHPAGDPADAVAEVVTRTASRGGVVLIPSFAVGRTQTLLVCLARLRASNRIPPLPVFLDSPMASDATDVFIAHPADHRLTPEDVAALRNVAVVTHTVEESKAIDARRGPMIVISASGMATGGRVLHHLKVFAPHHRNTILFSGYQAAGTRGASMLAGAETVRIHGGQVPVRAEVRVLDGLSAHADADELIGWIGRMPAAPHHVYLTHGEPTAADVLRRRIQDELVWTCDVPAFRDIAHL